MPALLLRLLPMIAGMLASRGGAAIGRGLIGRLGQTGMAQAAKQGIGGMATRAAGVPALRSAGGMVQAARSRLPGFAQKMVPQSLPALGQGALTTGQSVANEMLFGLPAFLGGEMLTRKALGLDEGYEPPGAESLAGSPQPNDGDQLSRLLSSVSSQIEGEGAETTSPELEELLDLLRQPGALV